MEKAKIEEEKLKIEREKEKLSQQAIEVIEVQEKQVNKKQQQNSEPPEIEWNMTPEQIYIVRAQQAQTIKTISIVRDSVTGPKRKSEDDVQIPTFEERKVEVFAPSSTPFDPRSLDIPEDFYNITMADLKLNHQIKKEKQKQLELEHGVLRTKEMRDRDRAKKLSKYTKCFIRIRFPDRVELQGTFLPVEKISSVYQFVRECLNEFNQIQEFQLYTIPPKTVIKQDDPKGLRDHGFLPACLIYFGLPDGSKMTMPFLNDNLIKDIKERLPVSEKTIYTPPTEDPIIISTPLTQPIYLPPRENPQSDPKPKDPLEEETQKAPKWFLKGKK